MIVNQGGSMLASLPNVLTLARIAVIPLLVGLFYVESLWALWVRIGFFIAACLTDYLDGYIARACQTISDLGQILDPLADKLLVVLTLFMLTGFGPIRGIFLIPALLIVARELCIPGLRQMMSVRNVPVFSVSPLAKIKTGVQMITLTLLMCDRSGLPDILITLGLWGLWFSAFLTCLSGYFYWKETPSGFFKA